MMGAAMTFGLIPPLIDHQHGRTRTQADLQAAVMYWAYIAYIFGVAEELIPTSVSEGMETMDYMVAYAGGPSEWTDIMMGAAFGFVDKGFAGRVGRAVSPQFSVSPRTTAARTWSARLYERLPARRPATAVDHAHRNRGARQCDTATSRRQTAGRCAPCSTTRWRTVVVVGDAREQDAGQAGWYARHVVHPSRRDGGDTGRLPGAARPACQCLIRVSA